MHKKKEAQAEKNNFDAIIVGAGFAGLYTLYRLKKMGLRIALLEAGSGVGGTWYWNRYPGSRCDVESWEYSYGFSKELEQDWTWKDRYATQSEILKYLEHVATRFNLYPNIIFDTRVITADFKNLNNQWFLSCENQKQYTTKYCIMATGNLSVPNVPKIPKQNDYGGHIYHTGKWPHQKIIFRNKTVGIIGTGSSSVQATPVIAEQCKQLFVFQRTPNWSIPANNHPVSEQKTILIKKDYQTTRKKQRELPLAFGLAPRQQKTWEADIKERLQVFEKYWEHGGLSFLAAFKDLPIDVEANKAATDFITQKICNKVDNPEIAKKLIPEHYLGCKRPCSDTGYYEAFNRKNVTLVDHRDEPITSFTKNGIATTKNSYDLDILIFATGFDAMTGALNQINITGLNKLTLKEKWATGPKTYLGLATSGFPNFFMITGPGSPSVLANLAVGVEHHAEWITSCIDNLEKNKLKRIEATKAAEDQWATEVLAAVSRTLYSTCDNWYLGANIPGKPKVFMPYIGGFPRYEKKCEEVVNNDYEGFIIS